MNNKINGFILFCLAIFWASSACAVQININTDSYTGSWQIVGATPAKFGPQSADVNPGTYIMRLGRINRGDFLIDIATNGDISSQNSVTASGSGNTLTFNTTIIIVDPDLYNGRWDIVSNISTIGLQAVTLVPGLGYAVRMGSLSSGQFIFDVAANGDVSSQNTVAATGSGNTLTFNNAVINVDPALYAGRWIIVGVTSVIGQSTTTVVPGLGYAVRMGSLSAGQFFFDVAANADVTSLNLIAASSSGNTLTFNTTTINVDPSVYTGRWDIVGVASVIGQSTVTVVPGLGYAVRIGGLFAGQFFFDVAANADVTSLNLVAASSSGNTLTFNTTTINVDPELFAGRWIIVGVTSVIGAQTVIVVPGLGYAVRIGSLVAGQFFFDVAANADITSLNLIAASSSANTLTFNSTVINIDPGTYNGRWEIVGVISAIGPDTTTVVPGVGYQLKAGSESQIFSVAEPCAINPTQFALGSDTFNVTCGQLDFDSDGVPDDTDNCPIVPNPDQVDQDLDGLGNLCDSDLDGDGVNNMSDNCPDISNVDQADLDSDGAGDVCDTDTDGDAVPDNMDNCPLIANTGQADSDNDLMGDACDDDDDNDGIEDTLDNCPLDANADQADFDGNGQGDICDGDIDGDGVVNATDLCPLSPPNEGINSNGCTGPQFIAMECIDDNFVQHGQYVSCVAHAAKDAADQGLITNNEKGKFVKNAASKK